MTTPSSASEGRRARRGVMGAQIAAHLTNADVETVLFDLPAERRRAASR